MDKNIKRIAEFTGWRHEPASGVDFYWIEELRYGRELGIHGIKWDAWMLVEAKLREVNLFELYIGCLYDVCGCMGDGLPGGCDLSWSDFEECMKADQQKRMEAVIKLLEDKNVHSEKE